jgi:hypothetical protein
LRDHYLPRLVPDGTLACRQQALTRLAALLPGPAGLPPGPLPEDDSAGVPIRATPGHLVRAGRIVWQISVFMPAELDEEQARTLLERAGIDPGRAGGYWQRVRQHFKEIEEWLLTLTPERDLLSNALCWALPALADLDPPFARLALNPDTWVVRALNNAALTPADRQRRAAAARSPRFGYVLNNALLHVVAALANNHFDEIAHHLEHPNLKGGYTHLMPAYLFAVLSAKVETLRQLAVPSA